MPVTADLKAPSNIVKEPQIVFVNVEGEEYIRKLWLYCIAIPCLRSIWESDDVNYTKMSKPIRFNRAHLHHRPPKRLRHPYLKYVKHTDNIRWLIGMFPTYRYGDMRVYLSLTGFPQQTISRWYNLRKIDNNFDPLHYMRNKSRNVFNQEQEQDIAEYIRTNSISPGLIFTNYDFREIALLLNIFTI